MSDDGLRRTTTVSYREHPFTTEDTKDTEETLSFLFSTTPEPLTPLMFLCVPRGESF